MVNNGWHNKIINHDVTKKFPLDDSCIDVVITSPPYWGLRDYGVVGQIGLEKHPQEYINKLVGVAREIKRVLKKSGSFYLNLGDTYFANRNVESRQWEGDQESVGTRWARNPSASRGGCKTDGTNWLQPKQLMLIPVRVAIALQDDGWVLRNDIIWHKPNPMPSSVKDRLNNTFEHVFHFVKSRKYYYDLDSIREPHKTNENRPFGIVRNRLYDYDSKLNKIRGLKYGSPDVGQQQYHSGNIEYNPDGKNPGDVLQTRDVKDKEYKTRDPGRHLNPDGKNPGDTIESGAILGESGAIKVPGGKGWTKKIPGGGNACSKDPRWCPPEGKNPGDFWDITTQPFTSYSRDLEHFAVFPKELIIKPLKSSCPSGGVVLDPFCGRGTVGRVAKELGLNYVLFDISPDYCELARLYVNGQKRKLIKYQNKLEFKEN